MKKFLALISTIILLFPFSVYGAAFIIPQGGTGTTTFPTNWFVVGSTTASLTATGTPFFSAFSFGSATGTSATTTNLFSTVASSSNLFTASFNGAGLSSCNGASNALTWAGGLFGCNSIVGGSGGTGNIATSTNETAGRVPYWTSNSGTPATLGEIATSSLVQSTGINIANGTTAYVLGSQPTFTIDQAFSPTWTGSHIFNDITRSTTTQATSTNLFSTVLTATTGFFTNVFIGADTLAEYISDTAGAFFTGNTETGITVTYQDADNTVDVVCDTASGSVFGCLSTTDWTTFNNKLGSYDAFPIRPSYGGSGTSTLVSFQDGILTGNASSTIYKIVSVFGTTTNATTTNLAVSSLTSALLQTDANGTMAEYAGTSCTNQFVRSLSALGVATCEKVANTDLANSTISGVSLGSNLNSLTNDTTLVGSSYNGSSAISDWGIDLTSQNIWTGASTTFVNGVTMGNSTSTNATTTNLYVSGNYGTSLDCSGNANGGALTTSGGRFVCTDDDSVAGGSANSKWATSTGPFTNAIYPNGTGGNTLVGIGTSTPIHQLTVSSTTAPQLTLSNGNSHFTFNNSGSLLTLSTSSPTTFGTSSALFTINGTTGDVSFGSGTTGISLNPIGDSYFTNSLGIGTTTPYAKLSVVGETVSAYFTATTSSISTFPSLTSTNATTTGTFALPVGTAPSVSVAGQCAIDTTSGQLKCHTGSEVDVFVAERFPIFSYSTTTWTAGTTTLKIGPASLAQTWKNVRCDSNNFIGVSIYDGTNRMNYFVASSTIGTVTLSTNNSFTAGEARRVDFGTSTTISSPVSISCTGTYGIDAD